MVISDIKNNLYNGKYNDSIKTYDSFKMFANNDQ
jgi:hypothetical protein